MEMKVIAHIRSDFPTKFGIPHQSGRIQELKADIIFEPEYRNHEAFRGLEEYTHIWLIWEFSQAVRKEWSPTVRPPRLGGNAGGFTDQIQDHKLKVEFPEELLKKIPVEKREALLAVLANDPRPGYQKDPERKYGMSFGSWDIHFKVDGEQLQVLEVFNTFTN